MIEAWAMDFVRALSIRPFFAKILVRAVFGKYAYREFVGLIQCLRDKGYDLDFGYSLESCEYHNDVIPNIAWWRLLGRN